MVNVSRTVNRVRPRDAAAGQYVSAEHELGIGTCRRAVVDSDDLVRRGVIFELVSVPPKVRRGCRSA